VLEVRDLRKTFGSLVAVDGVSFDVAKGEAFGLLGPNGAGKTTTISIVVGAMDADGGTVRLGGESMGRRSFKAKRQLGYVPQEIALYEEIDAFDNLRFFGALYDLGGDKLKTRMEAVLETVGLADRAKDPVKDYSGGMKRRLNIAAALLHEPELLILDEPTVGVDPQSRNAIFETLERLQAMGTTLIYTTHYMEEVERLCSRVAIMDHGRVVACDTLNNLHRLLPASNIVTFDLTDGESVRREMNDLDTDLPRAMGELVATGRHIQAVNTHRATLEEVFLHLTGKSLRD